MTSHSYITGSISGISKLTFERLEKELSTYFDTIGWKANTLVIKSEKRHAPLDPIFNKISNAMTEDAYGQLLYIGSGRVVCIYFGQKKFSVRAYKEPNPPDWWISHSPR